MNLGIEDFVWSDLTDSKRLGDLAAAFDRFVEAGDPALFERFRSYRAGGGLKPPEEAALLIDVSKQLGGFIAQMFDVGPAAEALRQRAERDTQVARFKKDFVSRRVAKVTSVAAGFSPPAEAGGHTDHPELKLALTVNALLDREKASDASAKSELDALAQWAAGEWKAGRFDGWQSFRLPKPLVFDKLVPTEPIDEIRFGGDSHHFRRRDGFKLTDNRMTPRAITDQSHYCIWCHERQKDSCAHGFPEKNGTFKPNPLGMALEGCPLDERIGEMNYLRAHGQSIAALAMMMIDNPMCPGTGHRICNDCMRACIFQKQDPVDIPQIETGVLTDVLFIPWGFEIYSLLTLWNPLNVKRPVALPYNGKNVLIVGLGPAGYTLAHFLANEGFGVVAIDGLKIEPLDERYVNEPIRDARSLWDELDDRVLAGFGGVSEYGITVRWDKNFLKVIHIALERKKNLRIYGGVRFGGTLSIEDAFD
ncbi:MAG TPA: pyridine nucleotide-disulfide oxidoreductase, partial [Thermoanaerobaculia bacterium]